MKKKLSTGANSTLGEYRRMAITTFGENSKAVKFLNDKILESPNGENDLVKANEIEMVQLLRTIHLS